MANTPKPETIVVQTHGAESSHKGWLELERIASLNEASMLAGLSIDGLRRYHSDKIIVLSPRRRGMRVKHALMLGSVKK